MRAFLKFVGSVVRQREHRHQFLSIILSGASTLNEGERTTLRLIRAASILQGPHDLVFWTFGFALAFDLLLTAHAAWTALGHIRVLRENLNDHSVL